MPLLTSPYYKPHLSDIIDLGDKYCAVGVNVAHSGSVIVVFFKKGHIVSRSFWNKIRGIMLNYDLIYRIIKTHTDNSGPKIVPVKNRSYRTGNNIRLE